ncbi:MAG: MogA/MoaB family molybdenum cofactor biosynthesis protein [Dehalococcoidia bacterium]|nr:MogA/MoaB family molybdenum cofactor biosynthesis protein [Dehalococcoidia bacterium]
MVRVAILTASDRSAAGEREDVSGEIAATICREAGHAVVARQIVPDSRDAIALVLERWCDEAAADIVITTGGTGLSTRDVTPEATADVADRRVPGIPIALALEGLKKTPFSVLSRGIAVTRKRTLIVNLPGNPRAVAEGMDVLLPLMGHVADLLAGPTEHSGEADTGHALRISQR